MHLSILLSGRRNPLAFFARSVRRRFTRMKGNGNLGHSLLGYKPDQMCTYPKRSSIQPRRVFLKASAFTPFRNPSFIRTMMVR